MDFELIKKNYEEGKLNLADYISYLRLIKKVIDANPLDDLLTSTELIQAWIKYEKFL